MTRHLLARRQGELELEQDAWGDPCQAPQDRRGVVLADETGAVEIVLRGESGRAPRGLVGRGISLEVGRGERAVGIRAWVLARGQVRRRGHERGGHHDPGVEWLDAWPDPVR